MPELAALIYIVADIQFPAIDCFKFFSGRLALINFHVVISFGDLPLSQYALGAQREQSRATLIAF